MSSNWMQQFLPAAATMVRRVGDKSRVVQWLKTLRETRKAHVPFYKSPHVKITLNSLAQGEKIDWEEHETDQIVMIIAGKLDVELRDVKSNTVTVYTLFEGESIEISAGTEHKLNQKYAGNTKFISVYPEV